MRLGLSAVALVAVAAVAAAVWLVTREHQTEPRLKGPGKRVVERLMTDRSPKITRADCSPAHFRGWNYVCDVHVKGDPVPGGIKLQVDASGHILAEAGAG
jgi:hypothetical protein